jgi:hypothetical protein
MNLNLFIISKAVINAFSILKVFYTLIDDVVQARLGTMRLYRILVFITE